MYPLKIGGKVLIIVYLTDFFFFFGGGVLIIVYLTDFFFFFVFAIISEYCLINSLWPSKLM